MKHFFAFKTRISYYYIPNEMTKTKYGTKSDVAILLDLFADHVRHAKKFVSD